MNPAPRSEEPQIRGAVAEAPRGWGRILWLGPGLLWMVASVGSGSVLFTPRVGSRYELELLWIALLGAFLTWVIIKEIGRYTVVSGETILEGYNKVPGPRGWAVWIILVPGIASGIVMVAGISGLVGSALMIALPGSQLFYGLLTILVSAVLVISGQYQGLERLASVMAGLLIVSGTVTAFMVLPEWGQIQEGLVPGLPDDFDPYFVLPWIGFLLAGAAGVMWFSYWVAARGFGGQVKEEPGDEGGQAEAAPEVDVETRRKWLQSWLVTMSATALVGIVGGTIINLSFLSLGAQLLAPQGVVPEGIAVAEDLAMLLSEVWGPAGFWVLIVGIVIALWGSVLANQDGWSRMYTDGTRMLLRTYLGETSPKAAADASGATRWLASLLENRRRLRNTYLIVILTAIPILVFFLLRDPVDILSIGGIISSAHMPIVVFLTLYINHKHLPKSLRPGIYWFLIMIAVGLYYGFFAGFYFYDLVLNGSGAQ